MSASNGFEIGGHQNNSHHGGGAEKDRFLRLMNFDLEQQFTRLSKMIDKRRETPIQGNSGTSRLSNNTRKVRFVIEPEPEST